jgi:hypothetical protein
MAFHVAWNWVQGCLFGLVVSGQRSVPTLINLQTTGPDVVTGGAFGPEGGLAVTAVFLVGIALVLLLRPKQS